MFDYKNTNTDLAKKYTDAELLKRIECLDLMPGWGLVAELCKRFDKPQSDLEKFIELYRSVGIELEPVVNEQKKGYGYQYLKLIYDNYVDASSTKKTVGYGGFYTCLYFDESGKFIQQGIWE